MTIVDKAKERGDFIRAEDGFYVYWPPSPRGALSAEDLRQLAAALDEMNKGREVERELGTNKRGWMGDRSGNPHGPNED